MMYLTPDLELELRHHLYLLPEVPDDWLFPSNRKGVPPRPENFLNRVQSAQAHMRHVDPSITPKDYQQEIPAEAKAAALVFERNLLEQKRRREEADESNGKNLQIVGGFGWLDGQLVWR
jgi:hypothetical protein